MKSLLLSDEKFCQGFFCGLYLFLGFYSLVSKITLPIVVANVEGSIWLSYVTWDLWWAIYIFVGWKIQFPSKRLWIFFMIMCLADFFISGTKLIFFSKKLLIDFWRASLFFNNFLSFLASFLFFFYLFSHSTRKEFKVLAVRDSTQ